jgi:hypothetical protein
MNSKTIVIISSFLLGLLLILGGTYTVIDRFINNTGLLFEGVVALSLGFMLVMIVVVASALGNTIMTFGEILENQVKLSDKMSKPYSNSISDFMKNSSIQIVSMDEMGDSPFGSSGSSINIGEILSHGFTNNKKDLEDMTHEELKAEISKSIKKEEFERADEISKIIKIKFGDSEK